MQKEPNSESERIEKLSDLIFDGDASLGTGSFASVRLGISKRTGRKYAIKKVNIIRSKSKKKTSKKKSKTSNKKF